MRTIPKTGELYKDITNEIYQIITIAQDAETGQRIVVYQLMSGDFGVYARPLQQFMGDNGQQCLFEKIERAKNMRNAKTGLEYAGSRTEQPENARRPVQRPEGLAQQLENAKEPILQSGYAVKTECRPRTQSPAESKRALRQNASEASGEGAYYYERRRRQMEEREQRREMFRKSERHESASEELRANPCLLKFLETDTYEEKFHVLNEIQNDITDRLIDDIAVVLDVVIPEGSLNDRFHQLRNIILTRQKYETNRFR